VPIAFGADSVASALHLRLGATPRGPGQGIMQEKSARSKAELLILHKTGTSHFALTMLKTPLTSGPTFYIISLPVDRFGKTTTKTSGGCRDALRSFSAPAKPTSV
jgi:hypothetical protein